MKSVFLLAGALGALGAASAVQAQDSADWTGAYVGAHAGWGWGSDKNNESIALDTDQDGRFDNNVNTIASANAFSPGFCNGSAASSTPTGGCKKDDDGFEFGGRVGYDWQMGGFVVGALIEASRTDVNDAVAAFSTTPAQYTMNRRLKGLGAIRARAGYAMGGNLIYVTGGGAIGDVKHTFNTSNTANRFTTTEDDNTAKGYQFGGGVEHKLTPDVTMGLEYIFTRLDDDGYTVRAGGPTAATNPFILVNPTGTDFNRTNKDFEVHSVRLTASYRF